MRGALLTTVFVALACSQRVTPEEEYAARERERLAVAEVAAGLARAEPRSTAGGGATIAVTLEWPTGPDASVSSADVLFVFVRPAGATSGPPLAVRRMPSPSFPLTLEIGPADAMIPGTTFPESLTVEARLDRDGNAMSVGPDDWSARSDPTGLGGEVRLVLAPAGPS